MYVCQQRGSPNLVDQPNPLGKWSRGEDQRVKSATKVTPSPNQYHIIYSRYNQALTIWHMLRKTQKATVDSVLSVKSNGS